MRPEVWQSAWCSAGGGVMVGLEEERGQREKLRERKSEREGFFGGGILLISDGHRNLPTEPSLSNGVINFRRIFRR